MRKVTEESVASCGLCCFECSAYPYSCHGCFSDKILEECKICPAGIRECAISKGFKRCHECNEFPCQKLKDFEKDEYFDHRGCIKNLERMKEIGIEEFIKERIE